MTLASSYSSRILLLPEEEDFLNQPVVFEPCFAWSFAERCFVERVEPEVTELGGDSPLESPLEDADDSIMADETPEDVEVGETEPRSTEELER